MNYDWEYCEIPMVDAACGDESRTKAETLRGDFANDMKWIHGRADEMITSRSNGTAQAHGQQSWQAHGTCPGTWPTESFEQRRNFDKAWKIDTAHWQGGQQIDRGDQNADHGWQPSQDLRRNARRGVAAHWRYWYGPSPYTEVMTGSERALEHTWRDWNSHDDSYGEMRG